MLKIRPVLPQPIDYLLRLALLATVYYGAARLGLQYASIGRTISLVWPPTGIAFAALTLWGFRYWPGIALGAFLANLATPVPLAAAAGIAVGNTLEALSAAYLLRRRTGLHPQLDDVAHLKQLVLLAAPAGVWYAALIGPISLWLTGAIPYSSVPAAVAVWWTGDLLGALVVAPVFFTWTSPAQPADQSRRRLEVVVLCLATLIVAEVGLGRFVPTDVLRRVDYHYLLFPFVIWAALRFGARGASLMTLTLATLAVVHTVQGGGPFLTTSTPRTLAAVAVYIAVVAVTGLGLAAAVRWERRQATEALAKSEQRLRRALDAARMGTWVWSVEDNTLTWDDNLGRLYGLAPGERVTTYEGFLARVHPDDRGFVQDSVQRVLQGSGDLDYQFRIQLPDGRVRWISDQGEVRRNESGRPVYLAGVCTDVTERRMLEERLQQAHRMESVGRLAGGVAHEANNQMSVVLGAAEFILARTDVPEAVRADVEFIQKAAIRTAAVTEQLLAFSRRQVLKPEVLNLNDVITGWEPVLRRIMGVDSGVRLRLAPDLAPVRADPGQLEQVLLNLALNARDAMPRGGSISLETFAAELTDSYARMKPGTSIRPGSYVVLAVSDTGHGMDKETLSHAFEPFFTTKGVGHGTGLGLAMVYGIVKQSEGYVWAYSEPGQGTTFKIYLPARTGAVSAAKPKEQPAPAKASERILIVEDDEPVRLVMQRSLESAGYQVVAAGGAAEALEVLATDNGKIDLLLTDVVMPHQSGPELADRILKSRPGLPVLFTSGYTDGEIARRGLLRPGAAFIQKPLVPEALVRAVRHQLDQVTPPIRVGRGGAA